MIRYAFLCLAALLMSACALGTPPTGGLPSSPVNVADKSALDERSAILAERAYQGVALAIITARDTGILNGSALASAQKWDRRAYAALQGARDAYRIGNAASYRDAIAGVEQAIVSIDTLLKEIKR